MPTAADISAPKACVEMDAEDFFHFWEILRWVQMLPDFPPRPWRQKVLQSVTAVTCHLRSLWWGWSHFLPWETMCWPKPWVSIFADFPMLLLLDFKSFSVLSLVYIPFIKNKIIVVKHQSAHGQANVWDTVIQRWHGLRLHEAHGSWRRQAFGIEWNQLSDQEVAQGHPYLPGSLAITDHFCPSLDQCTYHPQQQIHLEVEVEFVESIPPSSWDLLLQSESAGVRASERCVEGLSIWYWETWDLRCSIHHIVYWYQQQFASCTWCGKMRGRQLRGREWGCQQKAL